MAAEQSAAADRAELFGAKEAVYLLHVRSDWGDFDNGDHGNGEVLIDIRIAYLDAAGIILRIDDMPARTGRSSPPLGVSQAIEARPEWFDEMKFALVKASPIVVRLQPHRSRDPNDCYLNPGIGQ